jgi:outer membrane protein
MQRRFLVVILAAALAPAAQAHAQITLRSADQPSSPASVSFTLDQALQYAVEHYPTVRIALEQVNASTAGAAAAKTAWLPRLDAVWQTSRATANNVFGQVLPQSVIPALSGPVLPSASSDSVWGSAAGALLSWEPVDLGLRNAALHEAETAVARARADEGVTRLGVQSAVGAAFLAVVSADAATIASRADVERREVLARAARTLADNQLRPGAEASRAEAELAAARTRAIQTGHTLAVARITLARLLGLTDGVVSVDAEGLLRSAATPSVFQSTPTQSLATQNPTLHPVLQVGAAAIDFARAHERVLATTNRPRLFLQSSVFARGTGANADGTFDGGSSGLGFERGNWAAGLQVTIPNLFDVANLRARRAAASAVTRAEQARYDETRLTVTSQQQTAKATIEAARAIAENMPVQVAAARQSEAQARARYEAGLASIVEVADAQGLLASAEYQDAAARVELWRALLAQAVAEGDLTPLLDRVRTSKGR